MFNFVSKGLLKSAPIKTYTTLYIKFTLEICITPSSKKKRASWRISGYRKLWPWKKLWRTLCSRGKIMYKIVHKRKTLSMQKGCSKTIMVGVTLTKILYNHL